MNYISHEIVFQEVPGEISLAISITGCPIKCKGCHSKFLWDKYNGNELNDSIFIKLLEKYSRYVSCILFYGGEWEELRLIELIKTSKAYGLKTCLYTGLNTVSLNIKSHLNYLKTGPFIENRGPLTNKNTNQKFFNLDTNRDITSHFWR